MAIIKPKLYKILNARLFEQGYENVSDLARKAKLSLCRETISHAFKPVKDRKLSNSNLAIILYHALRYRHREVARILYDYTDDTEWYALIDPDLTFEPKKRK